MARVTGTVITVDRQAGPVYYLKARDRTGRQIKRKLGPAHTGRGRPAPGIWTRKQADDALRTFLVELGATPEGPADTITFADAAAAWLHYIEHDRKRSPSTVRDYRSSLRAVLLPHFGKDAPISKITVEDVDRFRENRIAAGKSDATINKQLRILNGIFKRAARLYGLTVNPVTLAERQPSRAHGDIDVLDPLEVALLASHADSDQDAAIYTVAAYTGLRLGELLALRWRDVDFAKRIVHVRWSRVGGHTDRPKSHRVRSVPLIDQAARALDGLSQRQHFTGPDDLVFVNTIGGHVDGDRLRRRYTKTLERAGLRRLTFHSLRHVFGTLAVQAFPLTDVKAYMGHSDISTTMIYVHHRPQHDAADKLTHLVDGYRTGTELPAIDRN